MKDFLQYIVYSGICLTIFWLVYRFFLSNTTFFLFNRIYLFAGLILSFILPAFVITYEVLLPASVVHETVSQPEVQQPESVWLNSWFVILCIYLSGVALLVLRNLKSYLSMYRLAKRGNQTQYAGYKVVYNKSVDSPFTLFDRIFMNTRDLSEVEKELILKHEIVHIDQKHWLDLVCSECALMLQWFNPLVWLYVSSIKENHEFQADSAVLAEGISPATYQAVLINQRFQGPVFSFANSFSLTNKSNRLSMIKKEKSKLWKRAAVLAVLPLFGVFFWASAKPHYVLNISDANIVTEVNDTVGKKKGQILVIGSKGTHTANVTLENIPADSPKPIVINLTDKGLKTDTTSAKVKVFDKSGEEIRPLFIVDGEVVDFDKLNTIPPSEIESVEVFKDKTATDLYGDEGKNGVVKVTKKKK